MSDPLNEIIDEIALMAVVNAQEFPDAAAKLSNIAERLQAVYSLRRTPQPVTPAGGEVSNSKGWPLFDRIEFALRDAGFDYDEAFAVAHRATRDEPLVMRGGNIEPLHPPVADAALAYDAGWIECAEWAGRGDLVSDMDSPAYAKDRERSLAALNQRGG